MKKRIYVFLAAVLSLFLISCTKGNETEKTEIVMMHPWGTMEKEHVDMREIYKNFEQENPDIKVKIVSLPTVNELLEKVSDMLLAGEVPDVIYCANNGRETLYDFMVGNDYALNLMPYLLEDEDLFHSISTKNLDYWLDGDAMYTISDVLVLSGGYWYNADIYEAAGIKETAETWEEFLEICKKIETWSNAAETEIRPIQFTFEGYIYCIDHMLACNGKKSAEAIRQGSARVEENEFQEALELCRQLYSYGKGTGYSYRDETVLFNEGKLAMYVNGVWGAGMIKDDIHAEYALFPSGTGNSMACESAGLGFILGNTGNKKRQEASVRFLKYMLSEPVQQRILEETAQVPANPAVDIKDCQTKMPRFCQAVETVQNAAEKIEMPSHLWSVEQREIFVHDIFPLLSGEMTDLELMEKLN